MPEQWGHRQSRLARENPPKPFGHPEGPGYQHGGVNMWAIVFWLVVVLIVYLLVHFSTHLV